MEEHEKVLAYGTIGSLMTAGFFGIFMIALTL